MIVTAIHFAQHHLYIHTHDERDWELCTKQRDDWLAAISREDLTVEVLESDSKMEYRVCSRHFQLGKPAKLYDTYNEPRLLLSILTIQSDNSSSWQVIMPGINIPREELQSN